MNEIERQRLEEYLAHLRAEHTALDKALSRLEADPPLVERLDIMRMKKRKLRLKDEIALLRTKLTPDIIA